MVLITDNAVLNLSEAGAIYTGDGKLYIDFVNGAYQVRNIPDNAMQQIAIGFAEKKEYIEFDGSHMEM